MQNWQNRRLAQQTFVNWRSNLSVGLVVGGILVTALTENALGVPVAFAGSLLSYFAITESEEERP